MARRPLLALAATLALFGAAPDAGAQRYLPENDVPEYYVVPPMQAHCLQTYRLFLPRAPHVMPESGWPVVIHMKYNGYRRSEDTPSLSPTSLLGKFLEAGIAVIAARATPSIELDDPLWTDWCGTAPDIPGHGLFHPPGFVPPDMLSSGIRPYDSPLYHMAEKDVVMLVQHVEHRARQTDGFATPLDAAMASLDHRRVGIHGTSAGAMIAMWAALGPDRRGEQPFAGLGGQYDEPTRVDFALLEKGVVWWPLFNEALDPPTMHFGLNGHSEIPSDQLGDTDPWELLEASPLFYEDRLRNSTLPVYMTYGEPSVAEAYDKIFNNCGLFPFCFEDQGMDGVVSINIDFENYHPAWSGYTWLRNHTSAPVRLAITGEEAWDQRGPITTAVPMFGDPLVQTPQEILDMQEDDLVAWTVQTVTDLGDAVPEESWEPVGPGLQGQRGMPSLSGEGLLMQDEWVSLDISRARAHSPVVAIAGFDVLGAPFLGGLLVPTPDVILMGIAQTDGDGLADLTALWPGGLQSGQDVYFQMWIADPDAPQGYSATNGLKATVP